MKTKIIFNRTDLRVGIFQDKLIIVEKIEKTCDACPSQWEGRTSDDKPIYVRYRYGALEICLGKKIGGNTEDAILFGDTIFDKQLGHDMDGVINYSQLKKATTGVIAWPEYDK